MTRNVSEKEYCHENLGARFASAVSDYDTARRVATLIDEFLPDEAVAGKRALDVGCGLGFFSERLHQRGAVVTACDLGPGLVAEIAKRVPCTAIVADALALTDQFGRAEFDLVVSSECIEHTPSPLDALRQMAAVVKPGGYLAVSTPNIIWSPIVKAATALKLRPFDGYENFSSWRDIRSVLGECDIEIVREAGLHLFPFQLGLHGLSTWIDGNLQQLRGCMINICVLGRKKR